MPGGQCPHSAPEADVCTERRELPETVCYPSDRHLEDDPSAHVVRVVWLLEMRWHAPCRAWRVGLLSATNGCRGNASAVSDSRNAVFPSKLRFQTFERFSAAPNQGHSFWPARCRIVLLSPTTHRNQHRQEIDSLVGQAVNGLLGMSRIISSRDDAVLDQRVEPVRQHIARNSFFGLKELAEVALARKHQVTNDQKRPTVA